MIQPFDHTEHYLALARFECAEVREDRRVGETHDASGSVAGGQELHERTVSHLRLVFGLRVEVRYMVIGVEVLQPGSLDHRLPGRTGVDGA